MTPTKTDLEVVILRIIQYGRDRCGAGFGKYPLGIRDALSELVPLIDSERVQAQLKDFDERLAR